MISGATYWDYF